MANAPATPPPNDERDRSRYGNRPGYTLADGSGCLAIGSTSRLNGSNNLPTIHDDHCCG